MLVYTRDYAIAATLKYYNPLMGAKIISVSNSFILDAPQSLSNRNIILLSKGKLIGVEYFAREVILKEVLKVENSHLKDIHIYILNNTNEKFNERFVNDQKAFYPGRSRNGLANQPNYLSF